MPALVIDHESTDATAGVARNLGATVIVRPFEGFVAARRFALTHVRTPFALMIDADERLDGTLAQAIAELVPQEDAYLVSRTTLYEGKPLRMWRNERIVRLFRPDRVTLSAAPAAGGSAQLHEHWVCEGETPLLPGTLVHDSYPSAASYARKFARYTSMEAAGVAPSAAALCSELLKTPARFVWNAFVRGAVLDGARGLRIAWYSAAYNVVVRWKTLRSR